MLHRHFEREKEKNITKSQDTEPFVSAIFPPEKTENNEAEEAPKKRGRPKKSEE